MGCAGRCEDKLRDWQEANKLAVEAWKLKKRFGVASSAASLIAVFVLAAVCLLTGLAVGYYVGYTYAIERIIDAR